LITRILRTAEFL